MPTLTIQVPPQHRDELVRELLSLYSVKTDALHHAVGDYLGHEHSPTALLAHRAELAAMTRCSNSSGGGCTIPRDRRSSPATATCSRRSPAAR